MKLKDFIVPSTTKVQLEASWSKVTENAQLLLYGAGFNF